MANIDEQKLQIEHQKIEIEQDKLNLAHKAFWLDVTGKIGLPIAVFALSWATYSANKELSDTRLRFEINSKQIELNQKDQDLFLRKSELQRLHEQMRSDFIQRNVALVVSRSAEDKNRLMALIDIAFLDQDKKDVIAKIDRFRQTTGDAIQEQLTTDTRTNLNYKEIGLNFVKQKNYSQAALNFEAATVFNRSDAESWNFSAYAQMQVGRLDDAYKSISEAIRLQPVDRLTQNNTAINATKILCSFGRTSEALAYLNTAIGALPTLYSVAVGDGELTQRCGFSFRK